tara:strand:+ start:1382 stop:1828 length:447 start_codon:yes stop_codon:yes gene_type:complete
MESEKMISTNDESLNELTQELIIQTLDIMVKEKLDLDSKADIVPILRIIMEAIEDKKLSGPQQKDLAKLVLQNVINKSSMKDEDKKICLELIDNGIIENTIDLISDASKGKLKINKKKAKVTVLQCLLDLLKSFNKKEEKEEKADNKI